MISYNLSEIYFSSPASFLAFKADGQHLVYCTTERKAMSEKWMDFWASNFFEIVLVHNNTEVPYTWKAYPHRLDVTAHNGGTITFAFADAQTILFEARGVGLRFSPLKPYKTQYKMPTGELCLVDQGTQYIHQFVANEQTMLTSPGVGVIEYSGEPSGAFRFIRFEEFWHYRPTGIEQTAQRIATQFERWRQAMPPVPAPYHDTAEQALLLLWNCEVPIDGPITRRAIFSSKAWMNSIWTWDNCFHALAVAPVDADLAWHQLLLAFDHQTPDGTLPDTISDKGVVYGHTKPPIYGWTIRKLVELLGVEASRPYLTQLYEPLSRLTQWWYTLRAGPHGLPLYYDGNDSGWDNATVFDSGFPIEGVDLATYLILQMETLAFMATILAQPEDAQQWHNRAQEQLQNLLQYAVVDNHFFSYALGFPTKEHAYSLQLYLPIMLGKHLPPDIINALKADLVDGGPFLTEYGLASESFRSPKYEDDGYWRGPIWAPPTYQIVDGLAAAGEIALARQIAQRYCNMIVQSPGFYENYDALTGKGLRCPGVCWTAAVFLLLAYWLEQHPA